MLKRTIKFEDYDGNEIEKDFYFNLNKAELLKMQMSAKGGMDKYLNRIIEETDTKKIYEMFEDIILMSIGKKSDDGIAFIKNDEIRESFKQSEAFSELVMELISDSEKAAAFINGIVPKGLQGQGNLKVMPGKAPVAIEDKN